MDRSKLTTAYIVRTHAQMDASNYLELIDFAKDLHEAGFNHLILDMRDTYSISNCGIFALHSIISILRHDQPANRNLGWRALMKLGDLERREKPVKLEIRNPQPHIMRALQSVGFGSYVQARVKTAVPARNLARF